MVVDTYPENNKNLWHNSNCDSLFNNHKAKQTPINVDTHSLQECHTLCNLEINYLPNECHIHKVKDLGVLRIDYDNGSYIKYNNLNYELKYIQFHTPSLHTIDFKNSEMEIILYHSNILSPKVLEQVKDNKINNKIKEFHREEANHDGHSHVPKNLDKKQKNTLNGIFLSILVNFEKGDHSQSETLGTLPNQFIAQFIRECKINFKENKQKIKVHKEWNVNMILPKKKTFYTYDGSLPYPPCTENFKWLIFEDHVQIINEFVHLIKNKGNKNSTRQIHPLNNRIVYYNNNIILQNGQSESEKKDEESIDKNKLVKDMLSPIRIQVNDIEGTLYRKKANSIIASLYDENRDYNDNKETAIKLTKLWDDAGRIGYNEIGLMDINDNYDRIIFDREMEDYPLLVETIDQSLFKGTKSADKEKFRVYLENVLNSFIKNHKSTQKNIDLTTIDEFKDNAELKASFKTFFNYSPNNITFEEIYIFEWYFVLKNKLLDLTNNKKAVVDHIKNSGLYSIIKKQLVFKIYTEELKSTVSGKTCQKWGTNKYHIEGNVFNIFRPNITINENGYTWEEISNNKDSSYLKKMIRDGLLKYSSGKFIPHDACRNPNNNKYGSWCYTTDPKVRWEYCMKPSYSVQTKKYLLVFLFFFIVFLAYYMVRLIFRFGLFTQFMSRLTGTKVGEGSGDMSSSTGGTTTSTSTSTPTN